MKECSIPGCVRPFHARGWCEFHYRRWHRQGDPMALLFIRDQRQDGESRRCRVCQIEKPKISEFACDNGYWRHECKACARESDKREYSKNIEARRQKARDYAASHREEHRAAAGRWLRANPERRREIRKLQQARRRGATQGVRINRAAIIERDGMTCYLCGHSLTMSQLTLDHVVPLKHGGPHTPENLKVCCFDCNRRKSARMPAP
jgi:5-methylcytosine-specific restriction endonuclease McrA